LTPDRVAAAGIAGPLLVAAVVAFVRRGDIDVAARSPITLFAFVWAVALGIFVIPLIDYSSPTGLAWAAVYGSVVAFLTGAVIGERTARRIEIRSDPERFRKARLHTAMVVTAIVGYIGFAFFLRAINDIVGWKTLFTDLHAAREVQASSTFNEKYGTVKLLTYASGISLLLWTIALRDRAFTGRWRLLAPIGAFVLAPYFFLGERLSLLTVAMWITAFHLVWRPARSPRRVATVAVFGTAAALGFFFLIGYQKGSTIENHPELRSQIRMEELQDVALPYLYLTANVPVLSKLMDDPIAPQTSGALTFWPAAKLSNLALRRTDFPPKYGAFYNVPFDGYNSATWLGPFYRDFGFAGCILMPALFGFIAACAVALARKRRTLLSAWIAAIALTIIAFSPLKNAFQDAGTWELLIAAPLVSYFVTQRSAEARLKPQSRSRWLPRKPLASAIALFLAAAVIVVGALNRRDAASAQDQASTPAVSQRLIRAGEKLARIYDEEGNGSSPHALATRLEVSDPAVTYNGVFSPAEISAPGVIDVIPGPGEFRLRSRTRNGDALEVVGVNRNGTYRVTGPRALGAAPVENGDFEEPLASSWLITSRDRVDVGRTTDALDGAYSLSLRYRRGTEGRPTSVSQRVTSVRTLAAGTRYTMLETVLTKDLSRSVSFGFQLVYRDGTSRYFPGTPVSRSSDASGPAGIPGGSAAALRMIASGVAAKAVSSVRVFVVDAGASPLTGAITVDNVRLTVRGRSPTRR
jgi:oligosaccharide repeat unit polymerase